MVPLSFCSISDRITRPTHQCTPLPKEGGEDRLRIVCTQKMRRSRIRSMSGPDKNSRGGIMFPVTVNIIDNVCYRHVTLKSNRQIPVMTCSVCLSKQMKLICIFILPLWIHWLLTWLAQDKGQRTKCSTLNSLSNIWPYCGHIVTVMLLLTHRATWNERQPFEISELLQHLGLTCLWQPKLTLDNCPRARHLMNIITTFFSVHPVINCYNIPLLGSDKLLTCTNRCHFHIRQS